MKLAQRAYLGCDLIPCANCIRLNISSWFGNVRAARMSRAPAPARRDVTMHSHADPVVALYKDFENFEEKSQ